MALSNIYKPQTNKFSHMGSDDEDEDSEELDDEFDDNYSKNFTALHSSKTTYATTTTRPKSEEYALAPGVLRRAVSCVLCGLHFFSICVIGLVFLILRGIDTVGDSKQ